MFGLHKSFYNSTNKFPLRTGKSLNEEFAFTQKAVSVKRNELGKKEFIPSSIPTHIETMTSQSVTSLHQGQSPLS